MPSESDRQFPSISVLMAVRDGGAFLDEAIASILSQSFTDIELIVVDNGSRDDTSARLAAWAAKDRRVRCSHQPRPGLARSLNHAAQLARAPVLARIDADDIAEPERLQRQYEALTADESLGAIGSHALFIDRRGRVLGEIRPPSGREAVRRYLANTNPFVHSTVMMRRELFEQVGGYRDGLRVTEDIDLWLRLSEISDLDLLPDLLARYRQHRGSIMGRQQLRVALADTCARAAAVARKNSAEEPFAEGRPQLRPALALLGIEREIFRRTLKERLLRHRIEVLYLMLPLPWRLKHHLRKWPVRLGLKPLYSRLLDWFQRTRM